MHGTLHTQLYQEVKIFIGPEQVNSLVRIYDVLAVAKCFVDTALTEIDHRDFWEAC